MSLTPDKETKAVQWRKDTLFIQKRYSFQNNKSRCAYYTLQNNGLEMDHIPRVKLNIIKFLEYNSGANLDDLRFGNSFLGETSQVQSIKEIIDKTLSRNNGYDFVKKIQKLFI